MEYIIVGVLVFIILVLIFATGYITIIKKK